MRHLSFITVATVAFAAVGAVNAAHGVLLSTMAHNRPAALWAAVACLMAIVVCGQGIQIIRMRRGDRS